VSDGHAIVAQPFTVTVTAVNHAPQFTSTPVATVAANVSYTYNIAAADLDGDTIAFQAGTLPAWLSLLDHADGTATLTGTPSSSDIGNVDIAISINDGTSWATQQFTLGVAAAAPSGGEVNPLPPVFVG
jgi:hypothetical protein